MYTVILQGNSYISKYGMDFNEEKNLNTYMLCIDWSLYTKDARMFLLSRTVSTLTRFQGFT